jgi:hypothetical protein
LICPGIAILCRGRLNGCRLRSASSSIAVLIPVGPVLHGRSRMGDLLISTSIPAEKDCELYGTESMGSCVRLSRLI